MLTTKLFSKPFLMFFVQLAHTMTTTSAQGGGVDNNEEENYLQSELSSLGVDCKRKNELNDKQELEGLATAIKEVYFQDYKTAYQEEYDQIEIDKSHFDHLI
jgi:hypothetical protein